MNSRDFNLVKLYHITPVENLPSIMNTGLLSYCVCNTKNVNFQSIAHKRIQNSRHCKQVPLHPFGSIHDYIPFHFSPRQLMLYSIVKGKVRGCDTPQHEIVHLVTNMQIIIDHKIPFVFTDGHAISDNTIFFNNPNDIDELDWEIINCHNTYSREWKRKKQAEFLIYNSLSWDLIEEVGVMEKETEKAVLELYNLLNISGTISHQPKTVIRPNWYW